MGHHSLRAISSAGRAPALQAGCRQFDPVIAHHYYAGIAQLVEHLTCNEDVAGSSPVSSSIGELAQLGEHLPCTQGVNGSIPLFSTKYSVTIAVGFHLFSYRTQKLSPHTPKVLGWKRPGRIGSC